MESYKRYQGAVSVDLHELKARAKEKRLCLRCLVNNRDEVPIMGTHCPLCGAAFHADKGVKNA